MKKYQVTWGWQPPRYEKKSGNLRLFYRSEEVTRTREHQDPESGETVTEEVKEWLCSVAEYEPADLPGLFQMLENDPEGLETQRTILDEQITLYDKSSAVEDFTIGGVHLWLDYELRGKVKENLETSQQFGETNTTLRINGMAFPVTVEQGWQMYYALLAYARACWNVTEGHRAAAASLESVEAVKSYDYTAGYPEKVAF